MTETEKKTATIVVLGDIGEKILNNRCLRNQYCIVCILGRSPRMSYHAMSLLEHNYCVNIVGYLESTPIKEITNSSDVSIETLRYIPLLNLSGILLYAWKTFWTLCTLSWALFKCLILRKSHILICQNPPAVPALIVSMF